MSAVPSKGVLLVGPDGTNPLGFLAALGTLVTSAYEWPDCPVEMTWELHRGWLASTIARSSGRGVGSDLGTARHSAYRTGGPSSLRLRRRPQRDSRRVPCARRAGRRRGRAGGEIVCRLLRGVRVRRPSRPQRRGDSGHRLADDERRRSSALPEVHAQSRRERRGLAHRKGPVRGLALRRPAGELHLAVGPPRRPALRVALAEPERRPPAQEGGRHVGRESPRNRSPSLAPHHPR